MVRDEAEDHLQKHEGVLDILIAASVFNQALFKHDQCQVVKEVTFANHGPSNWDENEKKPANNSIHEDPLCEWKHLIDHLLVKADVLVIINFFEDPLRFLELSFS